MGATIYPNKQQLYLKSFYNWIIQSRADRVNLMIFLLDLAGGPNNLLPLADTMNSLDQNNYMKAAGNAVELKLC